jgi:hypothetical protein
MPSSDNIASNNLSIKNMANVGEVIRMQREAIPDSPNKVRQKQNLSNKLAVRQLSNSSNLPVRIFSHKKFAILHPFGSR